MGRIKRGPLQTAKRPLRKGKRYQRTCFRYLKQELHFPQVLKGLQEGGFKGYTVPRLKAYVRKPVSHGRGRYLPGLQVAWTFKCVGNRRVLCTPVAISQEGASREIKQAHGEHPCCKGVPRKVPRNRNRGYPIKNSQAKSTKIASFSHKRACSSAGRAPDF